MKVMRIDTRVDLTKIPDGFILKDPTPEEQKAYNAVVEEFMKKPEPRGTRPEMERNRMTATEFFKSVLGQAIRQVHKSGNLASLRRTNKIMSEFDDAINHAEKGGIVSLEKEDFEYVRKAFRTADEWKNTAEIATALLLVDERLEAAQEETV